MVIHKSFAVPVIFVLAFVISSCGVASENDKAGMYESDWNYAIQNASTDFERNVLKDREISRDEYVEALDMYVACIHDSGAEVALEENAGVFYYAIGANTKLYDENADRCSQGTKDLIEPLYLNELTNPEKLDYDLVTASCLVARKVVDEPFTGADLIQLRDESETNADGDYLDPVAQQVLGSKEYRECRINPTYRGE